MRSHDVLAPLTPQSRLNDDFPCTRVRETTVGHVPVRALRVTRELAGRITSGGYGYTVGRSIAYAYLPPEHAR